MKDQEPIKPVEIELSSELKAYIDLIKYCEDQIYKALGFTKEELDREPKPHLLAETAAKSKIREHRMW